MVEQPEKPQKVSQLQRGEGVTSLLSSSPLCKPSGRAMDTPFVLASACGWTAPIIVPRPPSRNLDFAPHPPTPGNWRQERLALRGCGTEAACTATGHPGGLAHCGQECLQLPPGPSAPPAVGSSFCSGPAPAAAGDRVGALVAIRRLPPCPHLATFIVFWSGRQGPW